MVSMQDLIRFLWDLMRNDEAKSRFEQDPSGTLHDCGLDGVTARDVQDAQVVMQDRGLVHPREGGSTSGWHDDPIDEIRHTSTTYQVDRSMTVDYNNHQEFTVVDIDDRDTTVEDSFNGDTNNDVVAIQDNDTIDNNTDVDMVNIEDSFNDSPVVEPAVDAPDECTVDEAQPAPYPEPEPGPDPEPYAEVVTPEPSPHESDVDSVDYEDEELDASVA